MVAKSMDSSSAVLCGWDLGVRRLISPAVNEKVFVIRPDLDLCKESSGLMQKAFTAGVISLVYLNYPVR